MIHYWRLLIGKQKRNSLNWKMFVDFFLWFSMIKFNTYPRCVSITLCYYNVRHHKSYIPKTTPLNVAFHLLIQNCHSYKFIPGNISEDVDIVPNENSVSSNGRVCVQTCVWADTTGRFPHSADRRVKRLIFDESTWKVNEIRLEWSVAVHSYGREMRGMIMRRMLAIMYITLK